MKGSIDDLNLSQIVFFMLAVILICRGREYKMWFKGFWILLSSLNCVSKWRYYYHATFKLCIFVYFVFCDAFKHSEISFLFVLAADDIPKAAYFQLPSLFH